MSVVAYCCFFGFLFSSAVSIAMIVVGSCHIPMHKSINSNNVMMIPISKDWSPIPQ